jgi:hypothetical protein
MAHDGLFIEVYLLKMGGFSMAMLNNQMVDPSNVDAPVFPTFP